MTVCVAMGQCIGSPHHHGLSDEQSKPPFYKTKNGNLSATFHILDCDLHWDLLNVNVATEEQLMTLPGVSRAIARNIIDYRQAIGGFKKVEDLALVSGVGASKLESFRAEICVNNRKKVPGGSHSSSREQSLESLLSIDVNNRQQRSSPLKVVNVNTANMFQLMTIRGMSQEMAANIIHYRDRKGQFKSIDELLKVKCVTPQKLSTLRLFLVVDSWSVKKENCSFSPSTPQINPFCKKRTYHHRRTKSAPPSHGDIKKLRVMDDSTREVYELLSTKCSRPIIENNFLHNNNGRPSLRVGLWNLQCFSVDKAQNPGVREVVCRTILENGLSLIAVHEITSEDALALINAELNDPQLTSISSWNGGSGKWQYVIPPCMMQIDSFPTGKHCRVMSGFLFDTSHGLELCDYFSLTIPKEKFGEFECINSVITGKFRVGKFSFSVVSVYCKEDDLCEKNILHLLPHEQLSGERNVLILGYISIPSSRNETQIFTHPDYVYLLPEGTSTNLKHKNQETFILANWHMKALHTGDWGVVREGLSHLAIPNGWSWGGRVCDSYPAWVEIYSDNIIISPLVNGTCQIPPVSDENYIDSMMFNLCKDDGMKKRRWIDSWTRKRKRIDKLEINENGKNNYAELIVK